MLSARGRCGEESTFTVAALRTAGIPARQVYTPRWAHSYDNHAWVEIWFNGAWYYMGACEPEPLLDKGWFTEPVRRAMLVHTKSFGAFTGKENSINIHKNYTEVSNLSNYAEFYPLAIVPTDENGISQFETGLGDLLIWAYKDDDFDYKKISVSEIDTLILQLNRKAEGNYNVDLDLDVPVIRSPLAGPSLVMSEQNSKQINDENIIRQRYIDSRMKPEEVKTLALKLNIDTARIMNVITRSMGNYNDIRSFLSNTPDSLM